MRVLAATAVVLVACTAPEITVRAVLDSGEDTAVDDTADAVDCPTVEKALGGVCAGHDEDGDCIPDECDDCPNVPSELATTTAGDPRRAGTYCRHPLVPLATVRHLHEAFDQDAGHGWADNSAFFVNAQDFRVHDGAGFLGGADAADGLLGFKEIGATGSAVVATTVVRIDAFPGVAWVVMRATPKPTKGYLCGTFANGAEYGVAAAFCGADGCRISGVAPDGMALKRAPVPTELARDRLLLRGSVTDVAGGKVTVTCQIFDAPRSPDEAGVTLANATAEAIVVTMAAIPSGTGIGLGGGRSRLAFESLDVLVAP